MKLLCLFFVIFLNFLFGNENIEKFSYVSKPIYYTCDSKDFCFINNVIDIKFEDKQFENCLINFEQKYIICNSLNQSFFLKLNNFIKQDESIILNDLYLKTNIIDIKKIGGY